MKPLPLLLFPLILPMAAFGAEESTALKIYREKILPIVPQTYVCHFTGTPLVIDGKIDEAAWADAPWTADFQDIEGDAKPKPWFRTRAKMLWDENYFYVCAQMEEPQVWGTITEHDAVIFQDPDFEVFIDPDGDTHQYYEFEMNALNTGWDLFLPKPYKDGGKADNSWEIPGLKTAVNIRGTLNDPSDKDEGWDVELAIPWKVLAEHANRPSPPMEGDQWRMGYSRVQWLVDVQDGKYVKKPKRPEHNWVWSPQGVIDMHRPETWGSVQFTKKPAGEAKFVPDSGTDARRALMEVYYAQIDYFKKHNKWAHNFEALGMQPAATATLKDWSVKPTPEGYQCSVLATVEGAPPRLWMVQQDSKLTSPVTK